MKKIVIIVLSILIVIVVSILGVNHYKVQEEQTKKYRQIAIKEQQVEIEQRKVERNSNFYEKLGYGFNTSLLVLGNSIALSEGASYGMDWINVLEKKIESNYESYVSIKNLAFQYTSYDVGFTQIATLDDGRDYDAVMICYPACADENELTLYEAILAQIKEQYKKAAIIGVITNSNQDIDSTKTLEMIEHYDGLCVDMHTIIDDSLLDHEFYPNDKGYELYAESTFEKIVSAVNEGKTISTTIQPLMNELSKYENCIYVPLRKCRKISVNTVVIDLDNFSGEICIQSTWLAGKKAYDIYYDYGKWLVRNEMNFESDCWYDSFMFHEIPNADREIMIQFSEDASLSEVKGFYLISEKSIKL